jgi:hypothetical protein
MRSKKSRERMSKIHKGKFVSKETRNKISEAGKGRFVSKETRAKMSKAHSGEKNGNRKLTRKQVEEIRSRYVPRMVSQRQLAKEYGVDQQVIWSIVNYRTWKV